MHITLHILALTTHSGSPGDAAAVIQGRFPNSNVLAHADPAAALAALRGGVFDLVVLEMGQAGDAELELLRGLREHPTPMPVVLVLPSAEGAALAGRFPELPLTWELLAREAWTPDAFERHILKAIDSHQRSWELNHLQQAFQSSLVQYRSLFDEVPDLIFLCDRSGCLLDVNATAVRLFGQPKDKLLMRPLFETFGMRQHDFDRLLDRALAQTGPIQDYEIEFQPPNRPPIFGLTHLLRWQSDPSRPLQFQGVIKDISPHKALERELRASQDKYKTLYELASICSSSLKLDEVVNRSLELIHACCRASATLLLMNRNYEELNLVGWVGLGEDHRGELEQNPPILGMDLLGQMAITSALQQITSANESGLHPALGKLLAEHPGHLLMVVTLGRGNPTLPTSLLLLCLPQGDECIDAVLAQGLAKTVEMGITNCFHYANSQETETRYRDLWDHAPAYFISLLKGGIIFEVNQTAAQALGYSLQELIGHPITQMIDEKDHELFLHHHYQLIEQGEAQNYELHLRNRQGERVVVAVMSEPLTDRNGTIVGEKAVLHDVTLGKELEARLRDYADNLERKVGERTTELTQTMNFLNGILEGSTEYAIVGLNEEGEFLHFNRGAQLLFGHESQDLVGQKRLDVVIDFEHGPWGSLTELLELVDRQGVLVQEAPLLTTDGRSLTGLITINRLRTPAFNDLTYVVIMRDITEQKELEELLKLYTENLQQVIEQKSRELDRQHIQLIQSSKLATLGEMAAGIAHELNQPLSGIRTRAQLVSKALERNIVNRERIMQNQEEIIQLVDRITRIIHHMRIFARQDQQRFTPFTIGQSVEGALSLLGEQLRIHAIRVQRSIAPDLPLVLGEPLQIEQVILNLISNARDAMDARTEQLRVSTGGASTYQKQLELSAYVATDTDICLEIRDNGAGMNEETQQKIFEPFFTTKPVGRGTGLGLSISYGILSNHNGRIEVESESGVGSIFRVFLPIFRGDTEQAASVGTKQGQG